MCKVELNINFTWMISLLFDVPGLCKDVERKWNGVENDQIDVWVWQNVQQAILVAGNVRYINCCNLTACLMSASEWACQNTLSWCQGRIIMCWQWPNSFLSASGTSLLESAVFFVNDCVISLRCHDNNVKNAHVSEVLCCSSVSCACMGLCPCLCSLIKDVNDRLLRLLMTRSSWT